MPFVFISVRLPTSVIVRKKFGTRLSSKMWLRGWEPRVTWK